MTWKNKILSPIITWEIKFITKVNDFLQLGKKRSNEWTGSCPDFQS